MATFVNICCGFIALVKSDEICLDIQTLCDGAGDGTLTARVVDSKAILSRDPQISYSVGL